MIALYIPMKKSFQKLQSLVFIETQLTVFQSVTYSYYSQIYFYLSLQQDKYEHYMKFKMDTVPHEK